MSEGIRHLFVKECIIQALARHPGVTDLMPERDFTTVKADISFRFKGRNIAIEIQRSDVSWMNITERTRRYHELGVYVLWVLCDDSSLLKGLDSSVPMWQRCLHALFFGVIYYWEADQTLRPIHLERCLNPRLRFYNFSQNVWKGPSYAYLRSPWSFEEVQITDLYPIIRSKGTYGEYVLPAAHLLNLPYETLEWMRKQARPFPVLR